jgi:hypothetical protein
VLASQFVFKFVFKVRASSSLFRFAVPNSVFNVRVRGARNKLPGSPAEHEHEQEQRTQQSELIALSERPTPGSNTD